MEKALKTLGIVIIVVGIFSGCYMFTLIDWSDYRIASQVYRELSTNQFAKQEYVAVRNAVMLQVSAGLVVGFSGIISGIFFLALSNIIQLLQVIATNKSNFELTKNNPEIPSKTNSSRDNAPLIRY